ncbi:MAG: dATP/dGTP diphosphohydrolase domain-containing protein [Pseudomonadota bacterium]
MSASMHTQNIGDVHSDARGSGARYNAGKAALELIPLRLIAEQQRRARGGVAYVDALFALARFQEGGTADDLHAAIDAVGPAWEECAAVFDYGRAKYAEWNWAKGMPWSVPLACAVRHLFLGMMTGEMLDAESQKPHRGHFLCNVVMLLTYLRTYPEGDDRPIKWLGQRDGMAEHAARETDARLIAESNAMAGLPPISPVA